MPLFIELMEFLGLPYRIEKMKNGGILLVGHGYCCCGPVVNTTLTDFFFLDMQYHHVMRPLDVLFFHLCMLCTNNSGLLQWCSASPLHGCSELMNWM